MTTELIVIHDLKLKTNMDELATKILADIKYKYDVIVTDETVSESKKLMAAVNKEKDDFKKTYKAFKDSIIEPLKPIDSKAKEIEGYYDEARSKIANQVQTFELEKLNKVMIACQKYRLDICIEKNIDPTSIVIDDITSLLTSIGSNGKIASSAKEKIDNRIAVIENQILKARLEAEENDRKNREIAERAKIEAEAQAKIREAKLLADAEADKLRAVAMATLEAETRVRLEQSQPAIQPNPVVEIEKIEIKNANEFDLQEKNVFKLNIEIELNAKPSYSFNEICIGLKQFLSTKPSINVLSIANLETGEVS